MSAENPEYWPVGRSLTFSEAVIRLTNKDTKFRTGSVFTGDLSTLKDKDNQVFLQDFTLLGLYIEYIEECRSRSPRVIPTFNSFPKFFEQRSEQARFRMGATSSGITQACDRIERSFIVTLFPRSYGVAKTNLGAVDLNAGQLRLDLPIKRETENPTATGWAFGRLGQLLLRIQELATDVGDGVGLRSHMELIYTLTNAVTDTAAKARMSSKSGKVDAYFDFVRTATKAVVDDTEIRVRNIVDPRTFLAKKAAMNAVVGDDDKYPGDRHEGDLDAVPKAKSIGRTVKTKAPQGKLKKRTKSSWR